MKWLKIKSAITIDIELLKVESRWLIDDIVTMESYNSTLKKGLATCTAKMLEDAVGLGKEQYDELQKKLKKSYEIFGDKFEDSLKIIKDRLKKSLEKLKEDMNWLHNCQRLKRWRRYSYLFINYNS